LVNNLKIHSNFSKGEGKFSKVYKAKTQTGEIVAIKRINVNSSY